MSLHDIITRSTAKVKPPKEEYKPVPNLPQPERGLFIPASDKVIARDCSRDLCVQKRTEIKTLKDLRVLMHLKVRKLQKIHPEYVFVEIHTATVFERKSCYIFKDVKRNIKVAITEEEMDRKLRTWKV